MNNAITFQSESHSHLLYTARKKKNHYELISVQTGAVLIRLGKWEYLVLPNESFWIPFDALSAMTVVPNTKLSTIKFSIRTKESLPNQGGYVANTALLLAGLEKLQTTTMLNDAKQRLLEVIQDELLTTNLHTDLSEQSQHINTFLDLLAKNENTRKCLISPEMMIALKVREADKLRKSGVKEQLIAERYFSGNSILLEQAFSLLA